VPGAAGGVHPVDVPPVKAEKKKILMVCFVVAGNVACLTQVPDSHEVQKGRLPERVDRDGTGAEYQKQENRAEVKSSSHRKLLSSVDAMLEPSKRGRKPRTICLQPFSKERLGHLSKNAEAFEC